MHILFLTPNFPPEVNAPATRTYEHCRRWVRAGYQVTVVTGAPNWPAGKVFAGYRNAWRSEEDVDGIRVVRTWTYLAANRGFARRLVGFVSFMLMAAWCGCRVRKVDVLVATSPHLFCGLAGTLCRLWIRRPFVLEIRDIWPESIVAVGAMKRNMAIRFFEWIERRMYRSADRIVTVGDGYKQKLLERDVPESMIDVIPNGVDLSTHVPNGPSILGAEQDWREELGAENRFVCAYVGTIGMAHGLEVILDAAEMMRDAGRSDVAFWIVGDGAERERLERSARERKLDAVHFTGLLTKSEAAAVTAACDACLVHLRRTELFETVIPSKIFEAMAVNKPVIVGVFGQARDIVVRGGGGVTMEPGDPRSLIEAIDRLRAEPAKFAHGRKYVAAHFDRDELAAEMLRTLQRTVSPDRDVDRRARRSAA